ncbi:hypothetical protein E9232_006773 [Inquilinus ginsengisoli]|uniref:DUF3142 domain-containing protein n=1 Tax=Inquilinus ginsengisoli TaxID=363840 RepID=A0ABU1K030_9PROT|nr:DUF3142 domain-containing protein [Inquilinus ginsengisoli]MDR6294219.1 hypothetical protein [Inquilinus ginsengisoli]
MRFPARWALAAALLATIPLVSTRLAAAAGVDAAAHDAFWLWAGVAPQPVLARARTLYILQGQVDPPRRGGHGPARIIAQGIAVPRLRQGEVWLAYRAHTLRWPAEILPVILSQARRWRQAGNPVVGIQIDFDARTRHLQDYAAFLRDLRAKLPAEYRLSITGLMDWGSNASPDAINQLQGVVDEVVIQTYQGRHTIPNYRAYLPRIARLTLPFKIGLVQHGEWEAPEGLEDSPWFRGYVVFLLDP